MLGLDVSEMRQLRSIFTTESPPHAYISVIRRCLLFAVVGVTVLAGFATSANAAPTTIDSSGYQLDGVACPSTSQCTAVDFDGNEVTFNPNSPGSPTPTKIDSYTLNAVACPSTSQCTAVDANGPVVTFNPNSPGSPTPTTLDALLYLESVACPSTSQCTAVGQGDDDLEVTFNPNSPGSLTKTTSDTLVYAYGVACPSTSQCTAVDGGNQVTFNPNSPGSPTPTKISSISLDGVACASTSLCTATSGDQQVLTTFNPNSPGTPTLTSTPGSDEDGVACPSVSQCTGVGYPGNEVTFNPNSPGSPTPTQVESGGPTSVACPSTSQCTAVDAIGREVTFNPAPTGASYTLSVSLAGTGKGGVSGSGISCPGTCSRNYAGGTVVRLTATPPAGSKFGGWSGCNTTATDQCSVTIAADRSVTARFTLLPPGTNITESKLEQKQHQAEFSFKAIGTATGFQCALVKEKPHHKEPKPRFARCGSPTTYKRLKPGKYTFEVRAFNAAGADATPAKNSFTIH